MADISYVRNTSDARSSTGEQLWDLEQWHCILPTYDAPRPIGVPGDAHRDYGYIKNGMQHVVFRRVVKKEADRG